jgi:glycosyltransferase involved in cell wall biosynthesis
MGEMMSDISSVAIKICTPSVRHLGWRETKIAGSLARALTRMGVSCRVDFRDAWYEEKDADLVIHVHGRGTYRVDPRRLNVLWIVDHPGKTSARELERYDLVLVASDLFAEEMRQTLRVPVHLFPPAGDSFFDDQANPQNRERREFDLLLVGNNYAHEGGKCRRIIADVLSFVSTHDWKLGIVGQNWKGHVPSTSILGEYVEWDLLPQLYGMARIVLNDHHPADAASRFINDRTFDLALSKTVQISNPVGGIEKLGICTYSSPQDLESKILRFMTDAGGREKNVRNVYDSCRSFTYDSRVAQLMELVRGQAKRRGLALPDLLPCRPVFGSPSVKKRRNPLVSICVPTFNRAGFIAECLGSILCQGYDNLETIVVDDGSTDSTEVVVRQLALPGVRFVKAGHLGAPLARNRAIQESQGEYIVWLDSDDALLPDTVRHYVDTIEKHPETDVVYGDLLVCDGRLHADWLLVYPDWAGKRGDLQMRMINTCSIPNPGTMIRKTLFEKVGSYNPAFLRAHDWEFWIRAAGHAEFRHSRRFVCRWRWHNSNMSTGSVPVDHSYDIRVIDQVAQSDDLAGFFQGLGWRNRPRAESDAYFEIARAYQKWGGHEKALRYYVMSVERRASLGRCLHLLQYVFQCHPQAGVNDVPETVIKKSIGTLNEYHGRDYLVSYNVASMLKTTGAWREAECRFADLAKRGASVPKRARYAAGSFFHLGEICLSTNRPGKARDYFRRCLTISPNHRKAREYLDAGLANGSGK